MTVFLLLVLILLGVLLVRRTARLEERLGDLEAALRRPPAETAPPDLEEALAAPLRRLEAAAGDLRKVAESLRDLREAAPSAVPAEEEPRARILSWLRGQGLEEILLLDPLDASPRPEGEVRFEARRGAVRVVGRVRLEDGHPVAWEGRDSYASFP